MADEKRPDEQSEEEQEDQLKRPEDEVKDLEAPPEESEDVRGGARSEFYIK